jgi:hypothetical protein
MVIAASAINGTRIKMHGIAAPGRSELRASACTPATPLTGSWIYRHAKD